MLRPYKNNNQFGLLLETTMMKQHMLTLMHDIGGKFLNVVMSLKGAFSVTNYAKCGNKLTFMDEIEVIQSKH